VARVDIGLVYTESYTNPARAERDFREMRDMGVTTVAFHHYEGDLPRLPKDVARTHEIADRVGLKRCISVARLGGFMAGLYTVPDIYTYLHPESRVTPTPDAERFSANPGLSRHMVCVNDPAFREYALAYLDGVLGTLGADGLMIDEPQGVINRKRCECERCEAGRRPGEDPTDAQRRYRAEFISELCTRAKQRLPGIRTTMVSGLGSEPREDFEYFATISEMDALGIEPCPFTFLNKDLAWMEETCRSGAENVRAVGRQLDIWVQGFGIQKVHEPLMVQTYRIAAAVRPDAIWSFWYWRLNDDPTAVMERTREGIAAIR
jgi:hypothetical protein